MLEAIFAFTFAASPAVLNLPPFVPIAHAEEIVWTTNELKTLATTKAKEHGLNTRRFLKVIECESGWDIEAEGDFVKGKPTSFGLAQFHYPGNWGISTSSAKEPSVALETMAQAWEDDRYPEWSCWTLLFS